MTRTCCWTLNEACIVIGVLHIGWGKQCCNKFSQLLEYNIFANLYFQQWYSQWASYALYFYMSCQLVKFI